LNINDKFHKDDNNISENIIENDNNKDNEFILDKKKCYILPIKDRIAIKKIFKRMKRWSLLKGKNVILWMNQMKKTLMMIILGLKKNDGNKLLLFRDYISYKDYNYILI